MERFSRWVAPLKVLSQDGEELRLGVPNRFVQDWIESRYVRDIVAVLRERTGVSLQVVLVIDPELFRQHREERERALSNGAPVVLESGSPAVEPPKDPPRDARPEDAMTLDSFVVGTSNQLAFNAALQILEAPGALFNPFFVYGSPGVGKTHLLRGLFQAFRQRRKSSGGGVRGGFYRAKYLTGEEFFNQYAMSVQGGTVRAFRERYRGLDLLIIDDVHLLVNKRKTQVEFLHTFNSLVESGRQIVLASDSPPKAMLDLDPALTGRFLSGLVTAIRNPDYETRISILRQYNRSSGCQVTDEVLRFLAQNIRGSARELIGAVKQIEIRTRIQGEKLSLCEAQLALAELIQEQERRVTLERVARFVALHYGVTLEVLLSPSRQCHVVLARQVAMFLARDYTKKTLAEIGGFFGRRNHTTVRSGIRRVKTRLQGNDEGFALELQQLRETLEG